MGGERVGGAGYGGGTDEHVVEHKPAAEEGCEEPPAQQNAHRQLAVRTRDPPTEGLPSRGRVRVDALVHWSIGTGGGASRRQNTRLGR